MSNNRFNLRLNHLFIKAHFETKIAVQYVISDAAKLGALGGSRVGLEIVRVIADKAEIAVDEACKSYDRISFPFRKKPMLNALRERIRRYLHNEVRDIGRPSLDWNNDRDRVMDEAIYQAEAYLIELVDQFEMNLTSHRASNFMDRHKTEAQVANWALTIVALCIAIASFFKKG